MSLTKTTIRKLEKKLGDSLDSGTFTLSIMMPKDKAEQAMRGAKKQGKRLGRGIPLSFSSQQEVVELWESI